MVQVMVEVRSGRWQERRQFELLECTIETKIWELKERAEAAAIVEAERVWQAEEDRKEAAKKAAAEGQQDGSAAGSAEGTPAEGSAAADGAAASGAAAGAASVDAAVPDEAAGRPLAEPYRPARPISELELVFMGQTCEDGKALKDYSICHEWIRQVAGFVLRPKDWRKAGGAK